MKPYLSEAGKYLLYGSLLAIGFGVFFSKPTLVYLGEIEIAALLIGYFLITPSALSLDRRRLRIEFESDAVERVGNASLVGDEVPTTIRLVNESSNTVYGLSASPFGSKSLELLESVERTSLESGAHALSEFPVKGLRTGRFAIQGYDVSVRDPFGLIEVKDYLPSLEIFRFFPKAGRLRKPRFRYNSLSQFASGKHLLKNSGSSMNLKELRDFQPGDALRKIAWKQSMRTRKLISREFENETSTEVYVAVDISSSMRGGAWDGQKLEWAIHYCVDLAELILKNNDHVGILTFDEKLYGHIEPGNSRSHMKRILDHLTSLYSIVDAEMTELQERELENFVADYLLVQERLDFRKSAPADSESGVNRKLLEQWIERRRVREHKKYSANILGAGVIESTDNILRTFLQQRGVELPYRVEARLGMKERGLQQTFDHVMMETKKPLWILIVSDLCGVLNPEPLLRQIRMVMSKGHKVLFVVPFTPAFYNIDEEEGRSKIVHELFTVAESEERDAMVKAIRATGAIVDYIKGGRQEIQAFLQTPFAEDL